MISSSVECLHWLLPCGESDECPTMEFSNPSHLLASRPIKHFDSWKYFLVTSSHHTITCHYHIPWHDEQNEIFHIVFFALQLSMTITVDRMYVRKHHNRTYSFLRFILYSRSPLTIFAQIQKQTSKYDQFCMVHWILLWWLIMRKRLFSCKLITVYKNG